jgi:threonine synthase
MREYMLGYQCSICKRTYGLGEVQYTCPADGGNLNVTLDYVNLRANYSIEDMALETEPSLWRYLPLLPVNDPGSIGTPLRSAGWTPVYSPRRLADDLGLNYLWIKDESSNPTASFKDRASSIVVARAREIGAQVVVTASTGNAGAALAGMAAAVGQRAIIFAPRSAPPAKIAQLLIFGADVLLVDGTYDQAFDLSVKASQEFGWYCRNTGYNPFTAEGKKTAAFEIWEWWLKDPTFATLDKPVSVFVSVGDGNIISGIHKGFKDLFELGWIKEIPRIFGVQAEGSAAVAKAYDAYVGEGKPITIIPEVKSVSADTLADSISVDLPRDGVRAVWAASETGGSYVVVSDEQILAAMADLGRVGIFGEPAGTAAYAGCVKALREGLIIPDDPVMVINTGSGLKDIKAAREAVAEAPIIEPSLEAVTKHIH